MCACAYERERERERERGHTEDQRLFRGRPLHWSYQAPLQLVLCKEGRGCRYRRIAQLYRYVCVYICREREREREWKFPRVWDLSLSIWRNLTKISNGGSEDNIKNIMPLFGNQWKVATWRPCISNSGSSPYLMIHLHLLMLEKKKDKSSWFENLKISAQSPSKARNTNYSIYERAL